jgi:hypothetical protein
MTREEFINREVATWGEDYIFDLIDRGYEVIQLRNGTQVKWTWVLRGLTNTPPRATVSGGSGAGFTPVFPVSSASRTNAM